MTKYKPNFLLTTSIIAIFCNILWGTAFPALKIVYEEMGIVSSDLGGTITFISIRFFIAGLMLFIFALITKAPIFKITKKQLLLIITLGVFNTALQYFFFNIGVNNTSGIKASILGQVGIFLSVVLAHFFYKDDKLNLAKIAGLTLGFTGLILINLDKGSEGLFSFSILGEGFMIMSGLVSALSMFLAKKMGKELPTLVYTSWQMIIGSIILFILGNIMGGNITSLNFTPKGVSILLYLSLLSSVAFGLWYYILQFRKIGEISLYKFVVPVTGTILTALLIPNESLTALHVFALLLVALGIVIVNIKKD